MSVNIPNVPGTSLSSQLSGLVTSRDRIDSSSDKTPVTPIERNAKRARSAQSVTNDEDRARIAEAASTVLNSMNHRIKFSVHEDSGRTVITIVEKDSDEIIRQIPAEEILALMDHLEKAQGHIVQAEA